MVNVGCHVSIQRGYLQAAKMAFQIGASSFQYFPKNPRNLTIKSFNLHEAEACARFCEEKGLLSMGHAPYPLNLAVEEDLSDIMLQAILNGLDITDACGSVGLVVHFGKYRGKDPLQGYKNIIYLLNKALRQWHGKACILLENQAGEGTRMGTTLEELVKIRNLSDYPDKIGFCLDTCHAFASGLWTGDNWNEVQQKGTELGYFDHLKAVHLNDSMYASGSRRDRHSCIGKGHIGEAPIKQLLRSSVVKGLPVVLETPSQGGSHQSEIAYVQSLLD
ncbi:Endonuclease IV [Paenibacillus sp. 1_12]|uniref:deoxyribonuclease IV n=1 Tax=Paenibacillus sp. 1_12 TaxID=1566278 RepID=UPI0008E12F98|nr:deoxyribonuclease IV [Paenibacillus sp. 1_12]SFK71121.1 Endonuclease IV [Paenibacillus sp. 1_12]